MTDLTEAYSLRVPVEKARVKDAPAIEAGRARLRKERIETDGDAKR
jgi:hypothetical protein